IPRVQLHSVSFTNIPYLEELPPIKNHNINLNDNKEWRSKDMDLKQMSQLLKCSETEEAVSGAISALMTKNSELETKIVELNSKLAENDVMLALSSGKINQNQKEFALSLRKNSIDLYNDFIKSCSNTDTSTAKNNNIPTGSLPVKNNGSGDFDGVKYEDLLDNPEKMEAFKNSNPIQFNKMYEEYIGGR
nr:hypothetical protein [Candidatus Cloacimonadota bacterium]